MLAPIRKFSTSIFAKILLLIIIIPFVFWGIGSSLTGGNKNIVVVIDKEKYSIQDLSTFIKRTASKEVKSDDVENFLYTFIGEKLMETEIEKSSTLAAENEKMKHKIESLTISIGKAEFRSEQAVLIRQGNRVLYRSTVGALL